MSRISITQNIRDFLRSTKENELVGGGTRASESNVLNVKTSECFCGGIGENRSIERLKTFDTFWEFNLLLCSIQTIAKLYRILRLFLGVF